MNVLCMLESYSFTHPGAKLNSALISIGHLVNTSYGLKPGFNNIRVVNFVSFYMAELKYLCTVLHTTYKEEGVGSVVAITFKVDRIVQSFMKKRH